MICLPSMILIRHYSYWLCWSH